MLLRCSKFLIDMPGSCSGLILEQKSIAQAYFEDCDILCNILECMLRSKLR